MGTRVFSLGQYCLIELVLDRLKDFCNSAGIIWSDSSYSLWIMILALSSQFTNVLSPALDKWQTCFFLNNAADIRISCKHILCAALSHGVTNNYWIKSRGGSVATLQSVKGKMSKFSWWNHPVTSLDVLEIVSGRLLWKCRLL